MVTFVHCSGVSGATGYGSRPTMAVDALGNVQPNRTSDWGGPRAARRGVLGGGL